MRKSLGFLIVLCLIIQCNIFVQPAEVWRAHEDLVCDQTYSVDFLSYRYKSFTVNLASGTRDHVISGNFTAFGGSGDDIEVYVLNSSNYSKFRDGNSYTSLYSSGKAHSGSINVSVNASGTYYLVMNNDFSIISVKEVEMYCVVQYEQKE